MNTPALRPFQLEALRPDLQDRVAPTGSGPVRLFQVVRDGVFDGRAWFAGDVIVVGGTTRWGDRVVLVPTGRGRPFLGHVREHGLTGPVGEPCAVERWRPSGRVLRVLECAAPVDEAPRTTLPLRPRTLRRSQLELFAA